MAHKKRFTQMTRKQRYGVVITKLEEAQNLLRVIGGEHQRDFDADKFACDIGTILSCDNDEAGMISFYRSIQD